MAMVQQTFQEMEDREKINERTSRRISRNVQINPFITHSEIKTNLGGAGINISKDTISKLSFKITKKSAFTENQTCQRLIKSLLKLMKRKVCSFEKK